MTPRKDQLEPLVGIVGDSVMSGAASGTWSSRVFAADLLLVARTHGARLGFDLVLSRRRASAGSA
jgi:hypothetical protein